jgi:hypothetical protein
MTRQQLAQKRDGLEAQIHWAALHHGDEELMDVLRNESGRLSGMIGPVKRITRCVDPTDATTR